MAITQISRIQLRRGHQEDLPNPLASAELGWSIDSRKLYIGNGTAAEGAPELGNTEILTEHSDIFSLSGVYTFAGLAAGYTVQTGPSTLDPSSRTMQDKFDDFANARDFGVTGDGVTDDVDAFNRAITELYKTTILSTEMRVRRTLYVPAGTYIISRDFIRLLPYVKLRGDGKNSTFIVQNNAAMPCVISSCDSLGHTGFLYNKNGNPATPIDSPTIGLNGAISPGYIEVEGITFSNTTDNDVVAFNSVTDVLFNRVRMQGILTSPTVKGLFRSCVNIRSDYSPFSDSIMFANCDFIGQTWGVYSDKATNINVIGSFFNHLYQGVALGTAAIVDTAGELASIKVSYSTFDNVAHEGIIAAPSVGATHVVSAFNTFKNVGDNQALGGTPISSIVFLGGDNCYSFGDMFDRLYTASIAAIDLNGNYSFATMPNGQSMLGKLFTDGGREWLPLTDGVTNSTVGVIGSGAAPTLVEYSIQRATEQRKGTLKVVSIGATVTYDDEYVETTDLGIDLFPVVVSGTIELHYTTTNVGIPATLKTTTRTLI